MPDFSVFGLFDVRLFNQSSVDVAPLVGVRRTRSRARSSQMVLSAGVFALLALGGRRRAARPVRPPAARRHATARPRVATLGGDILGTKVIVFAASSAIAGVGGALYAHAAPVGRRQHLRPRRRPPDPGAGRRRRHRDGRRRAVRRAWPSPACSPCWSCCFPSLENVAARAARHWPAWRWAATPTAWSPTSGSPSARSPTGPLAWGAGSRFFLVAYGLRLAGRDRQLGVRGRHRRVARPRHRRGPLPGARRTRPAVEPEVPARVAGDHPAVAAVGPDRARRGPRHLEPG